MIDGMEKTTTHLSLPRRIMSGIFWVSASSGLTKIFGFITTVLLLRVLSLAQYGTYQLVLSAAGLIGLLAFAGIDEVFIAEGARLMGVGDREGRFRLGRAYFLFRLSTAVVIFLLTFFGAPLLRSWYSADILHLLTIYAWTFLLVPFERLIGFHFQSDRAFRSVSAFNAIQEGTKTVLVLFLAWQGWLGVPELLWCMIASLTLGCLLFLPGLARGYLRVPGGFRPAIALLVSQGPWVILQRLVRQGEKYVRPFLIQIVAGREAVALWVFAEKVYTYAASIFPIDDVLMPTIAGERSDREKLRTLLERGLKYTVPFYGVLAIVIALVSEPVVSTFFPQYQAALPLVYVICLYVPLVGLAYLMTSFYVSHQEQKQSFRLIAFRFACTVILLPPLVGWLGPIGSAIEFVMDVTIYNILRLIQLIRLYPELQLRPAIIFSVDQTDREWVGRLLQRLRRK